MFSWIMIFMLRKSVYDPEHLFFSDQRVLKVTPAKSNHCDCVSNFALFRKGCMVGRSMGTTILRLRVSILIFIIG